MRFKILFLLLFPVTLIAQVVPRNLLQKKCPAEKLKETLVSYNDFHFFPQSPAQWHAILPDTMVNQLIKNGEDALKESFPNIPATVTLDFVRNGDRIRYENILFGKRNRLWNLVLAESVEGKKRFMDAIVDGIWSIAEESFWGTNGHLFLQKAGSGLPDVEDPVVDLFAAETAATMAAADYFVGHQLDSISPLIRQRIYYEVNRRIFVPLQTATYEWMGAGNTNAKLNNWDPWIMSNYLAAVLFLERDPSKRIEYVSKAMQLTDQYLNGIGNDGSCEEGPHYWSFGTGSVFDILNLLHSATHGAIDIYNEDLIRNMGAYIYRTHISGNYYINVADSHPEVYPEAIMVWRYGQATTDPRLQNFGGWLFRNGNNIINPTFHRTRALYDLLSFKAITGYQWPYEDIQGTYLTDVQMAITRLPNGLFVAAHGGNNGESHNHNDVGDFIVYANGDPVIIDVGSGTYTSKTFSKDRYNIWFNASPWHNLPTINEQPQAQGLFFTTGSTSYRKEKNGMVFSMNIEKAYPAEAGLKSWKRTIATTASAVTITDNFNANKPVSPITQSFLTVCDADISQPGKIILTTAHGDKIALQYGKEWEVVKAIMPLVTAEDQGLKSTWRNQPITRILLTLKSPATKGNFKYIISRY